VGLRVVGHVPQGFDVTELRAPWASTEHLYEYHETALGLSGRWSLMGSYGGALISIAKTPGAARALVDTAVWMRPGYRLDPGRLRRLATALREAGIWTTPTLGVGWFMRQLPLDAAGALPLDSAFAPFASPDSTLPPEKQANGEAVQLVFRRYNELDLQITKALQDGGAGLLLGTDVFDGGAGAAFVVYDELAWLVQAGLTPYQALATATRNVAAFLGTLDSAGTVAVGKRADLVLLSGNPLEQLGYLAGPAGVMVGGRWLSRAEIEVRLNVIERKWEGLKRARERWWRH
jgi:hypothetical protein